MLKRPTKRLLILGSGPQATGLAQALAKLPQVQSVQQQASFTSPSTLPLADVCIELLGGISIGYGAAIQALSQGMGLIIGSPGLATAHGQLLQNAALGQGAFFAVAAHGCALAPAMLQASGATQAILLPQGAASQVVNRVYTRQESVPFATAQLTSRGADMSDLSGKVSQARAHALLGAWQQVWLNPSQQPRLGLDALTPAMLPLLRNLGLQLAYGSTINTAHIYTGLLALPEDLSLPPEGMETLLLQNSSGHGTELGAQMLSANTAAYAALYHAAQQALSGARAVKAAPLPAAQAAANTSLVITTRAAYSAMQKGAPTASLLAETSSGGLWAGVLRGAATTPTEGLLLPLPLPFTPQVAQLRLVA